MRDKDPVRRKAIRQKVLDGKINQPDGTWRRAPDTKMWAFMAWGYHLGDALGLPRNHGKKR